MGEGDVGVVECWSSGLMAGEVEEVSGTGPVTCDV